MAKVLSAISLDAPAAPVEAATNDTFAFTGSPSFTGSGGVQRYDWKWEVDGGGGFVTIAASGTGLTTAGTNPIVNQNSQTANSLTVICASAGTYTIRMAGAPSTGGAYTVFSATQSVTVAAPPEVHEASPTMTGGGVAVVGASTGRNTSPAMTGGGVLTQDSQSARFAAPTLTGGGVLSVASATQRFVAATLTGGGVLVVDYTASVGSENHDASPTMTGGGSATVDMTTARDVLVAATGGGAAAITHTTTRLVSVALTGGGAVVIATGDPPADPTMHAWMPQLFGWDGAEFPR